MAVIAAITGGIYYFFKNKSENNEATDDFDDFDDLSDFDEEEEEKAVDAEDERGYVTLNLHKEETNEEA